MFLFVLNLRRKKGFMILDCYIPSLPKEPDFEKKFRGFTKNEVGRKK